MKIEDLDKYLTLRDSVLFNSIDFSFLAALAGLFNKKKCRPGSMIFDPSTDRTSLYVISEGEITDNSGTVFSSVVGLRDLYDLHFQNKNTNRPLHAGNNGCVIYSADGRNFLDVIQDLPILALHLISLEER